MWIGIKESIGTISTKLCRIRAKFNIFFFLLIHIQSVTLQFRKVFHWTISTKDSQLEIHRTVSLYAIKIRQFELIFFQLCSQISTATTKMYFILIFRFCPDSSKQYNTIPGWASMNLGIVMLSELVKVSDQLISNKTFLSGRSIFVL